MNNNRLPSFCGQLSIDFKDDFKREAQLHTTDDYLELLETARANSSSSDNCCFCGFQDGRFLELHHDDDNHENNDPDNLSFICTLCHRLKHLGWVGTENLGKILYVPTPTNIPDKRMWLEPINIIQRFYLMSDYLSANESERLSSTALSINISNMLSAMKRQDINDNYLNARKARALRSEEIEELRNASAADKEKVVKAIEDRRKARVEDVDAISYFHDLHLLDLLQAITESGAATKQRYLKEQNEATYGRMTVWFNETVFSPFEPNPTYTLEERMDYYNDLNFFTSSGLSQIIHQTRQQNQFN